MSTTRKKTVLFLSRDGHEISRLIEHLEKEFRVRTVGTRRETLEILADLHPEVLVQDLSVPRIDHVKLVRDARRAHSPTGIISLHGRGQKKLAARLKEAGADFCVPGGIEEGEFRLLVTNALARSASRGKGGRPGRERRQKEPSPAAPAPALPADILDHAPDAVLCTDLRGNILYYSNASTAIFGFSPREVTGKPLRVILAKGEEEMQRILGLLETRKRLNAYGVDFVCRDGKRLIGLLSATAFESRAHRRKLYAFLLKDITASIRLDRDIYESKIELESVFDSVVDPLAVIRKNYVIGRANRATARLVGMSIKEVTGRRCHELLNGSDSRCVPCPIRETYRTGRSHFAEIESSELGEIFHVHSYPILDYKGDLKSVIEHRRIVTEQKKLEQQQHRLEVELMEKHKLSSVGLLAQGIAHNLNTPLGVILGRSELLRDDIRRALDRADGLLAGKGSTDDVLSEIRDIREQSDHILEIILKQVENMSSIIRNLMDIGRQRQDSDRKKLNINYILEQELRFLEADMFFKHEINRTIELDPGIPYIEGVYSDFSQSFTNIIRNAMDAMHDQQVKELTVRTYLDDEAIYVEIGDTGEGIEDEHLNRIFDPFFTTKDFGEAEGKPSGVGLGLHSCYQLLSPYGARFRVESEPGNTTFTIMIPLKEGRESRGED